MANEMKALDSENKTFVLTYESRVATTVRIQAATADEARRYWELAQLNGGVDTAMLEVVSVEEAPSDG